MRGEREPDGVPRGRVRVLAENQYPHPVQGHAECTQHVRPLRQVATPGAGLSAEELAERRNLPRDRREHTSPPGLDQVRERGRGHGIRVLRTPAAWVVILRPLRQRAGAPTREM